MWGVLVATALMVVAVSTSKLGFGLHCIRQNETASSMIGLNATLYKSIAFGLSACFVATAGGVYAAWVHYIDPSDVFDILYSVNYIQIHSGVLGVLIIMLLLFLPHGLASLRSDVFWRKARHA